MKLTAMVEFLAEPFSLKTTGAAWDLHGGAERHGSGTQDNRNPEKSLRWRANLFRRFR